MDEREQLERAMAAMEAQRGMLGDSAVDAALATYRDKLDALVPALENGKKPGAGPLEGGALAEGPAWSLPGVAGRGIPLAGRQLELRQLRVAFESALNSGGVRPVLLTGEAGIGKSRLAREFIAGLERSGQPFTLFSGQGDRQLNRLPYRLLGDLLTSRFHILDSDAPAEAREKILRGVEMWLGPDGVETAHWIGHLAGCDFTHSPYLNGRLDDPRRARQLAFQSMNRFLSAVARQTPLLVLVDDLHLADDGSLDWLDTLFRSDPDGPLLLLALARPALFDRRPGWVERWPALQRMDLLPLTLDQSVELAGNYLSAALAGRGQSVSGLAELVERPSRCVAGRAQGNPFFIEKLAQILLEDGTFIPGAQEGEPAWQVDDRRLDENCLPASLTEALEIQLSLLPDAEREVALRAAVVGPIFWDTALRSLLESAAEAGMPEASMPEAVAPVPGAAEAARTEANLLRAFNLPQILQSLQTRGVIVRREDSAFEDGDEYAFRSELFYKIAYDSQPAPRRREDHARVATWLAAQNGERVEAYAAAIAGHYERAEERQLAADWYDLAALQARRLSAPEVAAHYFTRALDLLPVEEAYFQQRALLYKGLWDVQWWQARYADALASGRALLAEAETREDLTMQSVAWNRIAAVQIRLGEYPLALRSVQRAERQARAGGAAREVVLALFNRGMALYRLGDAAAALEAGEQALAFNQSLADQETARGAAQELARESAREAAKDAAREAARNAEREAARDAARQAEREAASDEARRQSKEPTRPIRRDATQEEAARETARILSLLAMINQRAGRYAQAEGDYRQVLALHRERGDRQAMVTVLNSLGVNSQVQGDFRAAARHFQEALDLTHELGYHELDLICLSNRAGAQVELGEYAQAEAALREVLHRTATGSWFMLTDVYRFLALACLGQGRGAEALSAGLRSLELARQSHSNEHIAQAWRVLGRVAASFNARRSAGQPPESSGLAVEVDGHACSAHTCYAASLQIFVEMGAAGEQARTAREWASYELEYGDRREGIRLWQEARDLFARLGLKMEVERMDQMASMRSEGE